MTKCILLLDPAANRVYRQQMGELAAAELRITVPGVEQVQATQLGKAPAVEFEADDLDLTALARHSAALAAFECKDGWLRPMALPEPACFDMDLLTIPKYQGKTNEALTRMMINLAASWWPGRTKLDILDPMAGRGTTLFAAWLAGHNGYGVEGELKSIEACAAFLKTYLRTNRIKHKVELNPLRRDGKSLGKTLSAKAQVPHPQSGVDELTFQIHSGDTRDSANRYGKKKFHAIVTDAPYGVVHGSNKNSEKAMGRERSAAGLLAEAIPIWAGQLKPGGVLAIAWNSYNISRAGLAEICVDAGLTVADDEQWQHFAHRVDAAINRDLIFASLPTS